MQDYRVYMLRCSDGSYYTGVTSDMNKRIAEHNEGVHKNSYTYGRRPLQLVYSCHFPEIGQAIAWEKTVKRWSRAKKEALILGDSKALGKLAKCHNGTQHTYYKIIACHTERKRSATRALLDGVVSIPRLRSG